MKKELFNEIEIPEGVEVSINEETVAVKGPEGEVKKTFRLGKLDLEKKDSKVVIGYEKSTKNEKRLMNTITAHIKNMIKGVQEKFEYKLKICFSHFPFTVSLNGNEVTIKNFLGEKFPREFTIPQGVEVQLDKEMITVKSCDRELAGQTAASFETATRIRNRDIRIFQDGIYMISKCGVEI